MTLTRQQRRTILAAFAGVVWIVVFVSAYEVKQLAAKAPMIVYLNSEPSAVKIRVDKKLLFRGEYRETPVKIPLPAGQHKIKISREGYITHEISVQGSAGQQIPIDNVLERQSEIAMGTVRIIAPTLDEPPKVDVNSGLAGGETPLTFDDLIVDEDHVLVIGEEDFRCRFRVHPSRTTEIEIRKTRAGRMRASNCRTLVRKK